MFANRYRSFHALAATAALSCAWPSRAAAQPVASAPEPRSVMYEPAPEPEYRTRSYGWQTAMLDAGAVVLFAGGLATFDFCAMGCSGSSNDDSAALLLMGLVTYGAGGPTVHAAHGRWGTAAASLGMRVAPITIALPLMQGDGDAGAGILLGGMVAAMVVDATVLAREKVPVNPAVAKLHVTPVYEPRSKTGYLSLGRTF